VVCNAYFPEHDRFIAWVQGNDRQFRSDYREEAISQAMALADELAAVAMRECIALVPARAA
jgi:hypothetical protein